jgi:hypothetical protein
MLSVIMFRVVMLVFPRCAIGFQWVSASAALAVKMKVVAVSTTYAFSCHATVRMLILLRANIRYFCGSEAVNGEQHGLPMA